MKTAQSLFLPVLLFLLLACEKGEVLKDNENADVFLELDISFNEIPPQVITIRVQKPTPCYEINIKKTSSGNVFNYDLILTDTLKADEVCIQVIKEKTLNLDFDPESGGDYTLNFYVNGELYETREVTVTE